MDLFSKKPPCPTCGGKISWFLPSKIEGEYICNACYDKIDMESQKLDSLTMKDFQQYLLFYEQNKMLKDKFVISESIDFGIWDTKFIFDHENKLFCMSKNPDKTVFEGSHLKSFTIKEDNTLLFEGSVQGIRRYASTVPERAMAMAPQIAQFRINRQMARTLDKMDDGQSNGSTSMQHFNIPEPFKAFNVELHLEHPYWNVIKCDMDGPNFDNTHPDVDSYIRAYQSNIEELEKMVSALKTVAFPDAQAQFLGTSGLGMQSGTQAGNVAMSPPTDAIEEIKKYKALMEEGIISEQDFNEKKRQLLGI